jgi:hypothetical protein
MGWRRRESNASAHLCTAAIGPMLRPQASQRPLRRIAALTQGDHPECASSVGYRFLVPLDRSTRMGVARWRTCKASGLVHTIRTA